MSLANVVVFGCFFFFQAEDGIRDGHVTGVQTCALPILEVEQIFELARSDGEVWLMAVIETPTRHVLYRVLEDEGYQLEQVSPVASPQIGYVSFPNPSPEGVDLLYFTDGDKYRVWDGEETKLIADIIPESRDTLPTVEAQDTTSETGLKKGTYKLAMTYASHIEMKQGEFCSAPSVVGNIFTFFLVRTTGEAIGESQPSEVIEIEVEEGQEIKWSSFPPLPAGAAARVLYRTTADGNTLRFVAALRPSVSLFVEKFSDEQMRKRRSLRWENNLGAVAKSTFLVRHPNSYRLFAAGNPDDPSAIYYSEPGEPDYFNSTSVLYPTTGDGPVTGLAAFGDALLVFYKHSI